MSVYYYVMINSMKSMLVFIGIMFLFTSCTFMWESEIQSGSGTVSGSWETQSWDTSSQEVFSPFSGTWMVQDSDVMISFAGSNYMLDAGCNSINGVYQADEESNKVTFTAGAMTEMYCEGIMELENEMIQIFSQIESYEMDSESIELIGSETSLSLVKPIPVTLSGTSWELSQLLMDDAMVSDVMFEQSTLTLSESGSISGKAMCNSMMGSYQTEGKWISFGPIASTKMMCESELANSYEQKVITSLEKVTQYTTNRNTLTLHDEAGQTLLVYTKK